MLLAREKSKIQIHRIIFYLIVSSLIFGEV